MNVNDDIFDTGTATLRERLALLHEEHHDLDDAIARLGDTPTCDELSIRRMKKRKLVLKDRITQIEHLLEPDDLA